VDLRPRARSERDFRREAYRRDRVYAEDRLSRRQRYDDQSIVRRDDGY
jgi:hypothetical protein